MNGLFLQGGGAKGAFQAGAIYAMYEKGLNFHILSGTSIGSVNGYFIYKNSIEEMRKFYTETNLEDITKKLQIKNTIPNGYLINQIENLAGFNSNIKNFYVNYVNIENKNLKEIRADITKLTKQDAINCIKYSSLLPYVLPLGIKSLSFNEIAKKFNSQDMLKNFNIKVKEGTYDNMNIDGGILNNNFMEPFISNYADKLYLIALHNGFKIPEYILNKYEKIRILLVQRETPFNSNDSLNYNKNFLCLLFKNGYETAYKVIK